MRTILQNSRISPTKCLYPCAVEICIERGTCSHRFILSHFFSLFSFLPVSLFLSVISFVCAHKIESVCSFRFLTVIVENKVDYHNFRVCYTSKLPELKLLYDTSIADLLECYDTDFQENRIQYYNINIAINRTFDNPSSGI